ncbi:MAG: ABC transporter substrate-binding protein [Betaproteobacteria bacterium]
MQGESTNPIAQRKCRIRRRHFLLATAGLIAAGIAHAQPQRKPVRIGLLSTLARSEAEALQGMKPFIDGMRERGYLHGEHFVLDIRISGGDARRFPALAEELVALRPTVLLGVETAALAMAARTKTIPIVLYSSIDPVVSGLVKSLARPGTNVTGLSGQFDALTAKHIELLLEFAPKASRIAMLGDPFWSARQSYEQYAQTAAAARGLSLTIIHVKDAGDVQQAFMQFEKLRPDGLLVAVTGLTWALRDAIHEGTGRLRLPAIGYATPGGLVSYGPNIAANLYETADFVDRILKGAKPEDLPVRQATKYELIVNMKTARAIDLKVPQSILLRADRVIE